jgi:hypothetical protein
MYTRLSTSCPGPGVDVAARKQAYSSSQTTLMLSRNRCKRTQIQCTQSLESLTVREKRDFPLIRTHSVYFKYHYLDIDDWEKGPDTVGELGSAENCASRMASLKAQDHENAYIERFDWEARNRFANSIGPFLR